MITEPKFFECESSTQEGRILTVEEQTQTITFERFHEWMIEVGEDYVDQTSMPKTANLIFIGFLLHKYSGNALVQDRLLRVATEKILDTQSIQQIVYEDSYADEPNPFMGNLPEGTEEWEPFYYDLADFINHTENLKAQTNANLILRMDYYKPNRSTDAETDSSN